MLNRELMRRDVAIEIIAEMIADTSIALESEKDQKRIKELEEKNQKYKYERNQIYLGNEETVDYVIEVYGSYLKEQR